MKKGERMNPLSLEQNFVPAYLYLYCTIIITVIIAKLRAKRRLVIKVYLSSSFFLSNSIFFSYYLKNLVKSIKRKTCAIILTQVFLFYEKGSIYPLKRTKFCASIKKYRGGILFELQFIMNGSNENTDRLNTTRKNLPIIEVIRERKNV